VSFSLNKSEYTVSAGESGSLTVSYSPEGTSQKGISWSSSDTSVVSIGTSDENGVALNYLKAGDATITATSTVKTSLTATCLIHVKDYTTLKLVKLTAVDQLVEGATIVIGATASSKIYAAGALNNNYRTPVDVTSNLSAGEIGFNSKVAYLTLGSGASAGTYSFNDGTGYLCSAGSGNYLNVETTLSANSSWTLSFSDSHWSIVASAGGSTNIAYNASAGRFSCYAASYLSGGYGTYPEIYEDVSKFTAAMDWATAFNSTLSPICTSGVNNTTPSADLLNAWSSQGTNYSALSTLQKSFIKNAAGELTGNPVGQAVLRYDGILGKYGVSTLSNFVDRPTSGSFNASALSGSADWAILLVVGLSALGLVVAAGVIFLRKKHH
jgi:hypothetical protein